LCWDTSNQSGGSPENSNSYGYVYSWSNASALCSSMGKRLPSFSEFQAFANAGYVSQFTSSRGGFYYWYHYWTWGSVGQSCFVWTSKPNTWAVIVEGSSSFEEVTTNLADAYVFVRCVKAL
jgi:hypothetical protein